MEIIVQVQYILSHLFSISTFKTFWKIDNVSGHFYAEIQNNLKAWQRSNITVNGGIFTRQHSGKVALKKKTVWD